MANIVETLPFNFDEIYQDLVVKFTDKGYTDAVYEGSNTAQLISTLAYTVSMLNANTSANINETILSLAQKRDNVIQDARMLGYEIEHQKSYVYKLELKFLSDGDKTIYRYSSFSSGDKTYYFMSSDVTLKNKRTYVGIDEHEVKDYVVDNEVFSGRNYYRCIQDHIIGDNIALTNSLYWSDITDK